MIGELELLCPGVLLGTNLALTTVKVNSFVGMIVYLDH